MIKLFVNRLVVISFMIFMGSLFLHFIFYPSLALTPWTWGSTLLHSKRENLLHKDPPYNGLVIGSSRVFRQVNPQVIDSVLNTTTTTRTFNLGVNWLFAPESFYVYNQLTGADQLHFNFVVIELSKIRSIDYSNLHTSRIKYWYNFSNFSFSINAIAASNFSFIEKVATIMAHKVSYAGKLINLGYLTEAFNFITSINPVNLSSNGFEPLNVDLSASQEENVSARNARFLSDTSVVTERLNMSIKQFQKFEDDPGLLNNYNRVYAEELNRMITDARMKNIHLVFLLSPRIDKNQYNELIPLFHHIHPGHRVELSDGRKYPELYHADNSFDETHLNGKGADRYSLLLAQKLRELPGFKK